MRLFVFIIKLIRRILSQIDILKIKTKISILSLQYPSRLKISKCFNAAFDFELSLDASDSTIVIGKEVRGRKRLRLYAGCNGQLSVGDRVFFNNGCSINCMELISIGNDCHFGEDVKLYDHNHAYKNIALPINRQGYVTGAISIGNNCWIGSNVTILKNVTIGNNVVIGAGCVIHQSVEDNTLVFNNQSISIKKIM